MRNGHRTRPEEQSAHQDPPNRSLYGFGGLPSGHGGQAGVVQGASDPQRELLDVESVAGHLLPAGTVFAFLAEQRSRLFPGEMFQDLFPSGLGRPSVPPEVVAAVMVLQALHGLADRAH